MEKDGLAPLAQRLQTMDPETAARVGPHDPVRILRALEILTLTGSTQSERSRSHRWDAPLRQDATWVLVQAPSDWLGPRLERRARVMWERGLLDEACRLRERLGPEHGLLRTMGYAEALRVADGAWTRAEGLERTVIRQRQYAKRQRTWFRKETWWREISAPEGELLSQLGRLL